MCVLKDRYAHTNEYVSESPSVSIIPVRQFVLSVVSVFFFYTKDYTTDFSSCT